MAEPEKKSLDGPLKLIIIYKHRLKLEQASSTKLKLRSLTKKIGWILK